MKTERIQMQITNNKQLAQIWANDPNDQNWTDFCHGMNDLVRITIEDAPPKIEVREVPVNVEVPGPVREVVKVETVIQEVPVFNQE